MCIFDWKNGEYQYCADIVRHGGDENVPRDTIVSYIDVQIASAKKDKRADVVEALSTLRGHALEVWSD